MIKQNAIMLETQAIHRSGVQEWLLELFERIVLDTYVAGVEILSAFCSFNREDDRNGALAIRTHIRIKKSVMPNQHIASRSILEPVGSICVK